MARRAPRTKPQTPLRGAVATAFHRSPGWRRRRRPLPLRPMPYASINGTRLYYEDTGGIGAPILFSHGLLWSCRMFDAQVNALRQEGFRCIAYDHRGQGRSDPVVTRSVTIEQCYEDALALIEQLTIGPCHVAGLSMGGFVAMRLGARHPAMVRSLILMETSADAEPIENLGKYKRLNWTWKWLGPSLIATPVMQVMFSQSFLRDPDQARLRTEQEALLRGNRRDIWRAVNGVIEREAIAPELGKIRCPVTIIVGEEDVATVPAKAERIQALIGGSKLVRVPRAGHTSTVEQPVLVTEAIREHLGTCQLV